MKTGWPYLKALHLRKVRCFQEAVTIDFAPHGEPARFTVLLGENGTGKTTALLAIANTLNEFEESGWDYSVELVPKIRIERPTNHVPSSFSEQDAEPFKRALFGYGAHRRCSLAASEERSRTDTINLLVNPEAKLRDLNLLVVTAEAQQGQLRQRLRTILFEEPGLIEAITNYRVPATGRFEIEVEWETPDGWVPTHHLAEGYKSTLTWVVDLASRLVEDYPDLENPLEAPCVVLVDEIDNHLHPKWQREIVPYLLRNFPNAQFVATTHSPLVAQAAADHNIVLLRRDGSTVRVNNDPTVIKNWRIDQILTSELFDLPTARPKPVEDLILRRRELIATVYEIGPEEEAKIHELDEKIGDLPAGENAQLSQDLKEAAALLRRMSKS